MPQRSLNRWGALVLIKGKPAGFPTQSEPRYNRGRLDCRPRQDTSAAKERRRVTQQYARNGSGWLPGSPASALGEASIRYFPNGRTRSKELPMGICRCAASASLRHVPPARLLVRIHARVCTPDEVLDTPRAPGFEPHPPDAHGDPHDAAAPVVQLDTLLEPRGDRPLVRLRRVHGEHDELVAAMTRDDVRLPERAAEDRCDALQDLVARVMAQGIVDRLQPVDVDDEQRHASPVAPTEPQLLPGHGQEAAAIVETGELVGHRQLAHGGGPVLQPDRFACRVD